MMRFLVTDESKRLARWMRLAGYDVEVMPAQPLAALYRRACNEGRAIVTRNGRVKASCLFRVVRIASGRLEDQMKQLVREIGLSIDEEQMFSRCDRCNEELEDIEKAAVKERVPPYVYQTQQAFYTCPSCQRIYWAATHYERAQGFFKRLRDA